MQTLQERLRNIPLLLPIGVLLAVAIAALLLFLLGVKPREEAAKGEVQQELTDEQKKAILEQLAKQKEGKSELTREEKMDILKDLQQSSKEDTLSEEEKIKLLESLQNKK